MRGLWAPQKAGTKTALPNAGKRLVVGVAEEIELISRGTLRGALRESSDFWNYFRNACNLFAVEEINSKFFLARMGRRL
jgi:hypothetical protein